MMTGRSLSMMVTAAAVAGVLMLPGAAFAQAAACTAAQASVGATIEAAIRHLEAARLTNSAAAMRAATDALQNTLLDIRTQLQPCAKLDAADPHAGHAMPAAPAPAAPATGSAPPAAATPADAHAGHVMPAPVPAAGGAPRAAPQATAKPATPATRPAPPADPHAGHTMPAAPAAATRSTRPSSSAPPAAAARPGAPTAPAVAAPAAPATAPTGPAPATSVDALTCAPGFDRRMAPRMLHQGKMYYFCSERERAAFAKEPGRYVSPAPVAAPSHAH